MEAGSISERVSPFHASDVESILRARGWLTVPSTLELESWMRDAADWLGMQAASHSEVANDQRERVTCCLSRELSYDAGRVMELRENQATMASEGARETVRELANRVMQGSEIDSARLREIIDG